MKYFSFRAGLYGQSDILGFRPSPGDLAYPEKLIMMKKIELESAAAKVILLPFHTFFVDFMLHYSFYSLEEN